MAVRCSDIPNYLNKTKLCRTVPVPSLCTSSSIASCLSSINVSTIIVLIIFHYHCHNRIHQLFYCCFSHLSSIFPSSLSPSLSSLSPLLKQKNTQATSWTVLDGADGASCRLNCKNADNLDVTTTCSNGEWSKPEKLVAKCG